MKVQHLKMAKEKACGIITATNTQDDFVLLKNMSADAYRFSIAWPRLIPSGKISNGVNDKGIEHYNNTVNELIAQGYTPYVTIFHWQTPMVLELEYGGFLNESIVEDFKDFAELCFQMFGDRVKNRITLNEPWTYSNGGYAQGVSPFRCTIRIAPVWIQRPTICFLLMQLPLMCTRPNIRFQSYIFTKVELLLYNNKICLCRVGLSSSMA